MTQQECHAHSRHHLVSLSRAAFPSDFFLIRISFNFFCEILIRIFLQLLMRKSPISSAANNLLSLFANMEPVKSFARTPLQRPLMQKPLCRMRNHSHSVEKLLLLAQIHLPFKTKQAPSKCDCEIVHLAQNYPTEQKKRAEFASALVRMYSNPISDPNISCHKNITSHKNITAVHDGKLLE